MVALEEGASWMGPLEYPNDAKQIRITFILLPIAAVLFALLVGISAVSM